MRETYTKDFIQTIVDLSLEYVVKKVTTYHLINQKKSAVTMDDDEISKIDIISLKKRIHGSRDNMIYDVN